MIRLGITGGLGSGKSLALKVLREQGIPVEDADRIAKELISRQEDLKKKISFQFGEDIYSKGELNRALLAERAFSCRVNQETLNSLVHPAVRDAVQNFFRKTEELGHPLAAVEASVLLEAGHADAYDRILLITADEPVRLARALLRSGLSEEQIRARMALQMPEEQKRKLCHSVIENNGSPDQLKMALLDLLERLLNPDR